MEQYNGWSNYSTWMLYNRLSSEEASYDEWIARATALADKMPLEDAVGRLARWIKEELEENMEGVGFFGDVESWVMTEIDFNEVASALLEDVE